MGAIISPTEKERMLPFIRSHFGKMSEREMARKLGIGKTTANKWCRELGFVINKDTVDANYFKIWSSEMAYILGFIFADGNINWRPEKSYWALTITSAEKDKEHLEKIRLKMKSTKKLRYSKNTKSYRLIINNKTLCIDLMKLGVIPRKSLTVQFPSKVPKKFLSHFIRGIVDGDGNVRYVKRERSPYFEITIASGSKRFLTKLSREIFKIGISRRVRKTNKNVFILQYSCKRGLNLAKWIYKDSNLFLDRKIMQYKLALAQGMSSDE